MDIWIVRVSMAGSALSGCPVGLSVPYGNGAVAASMLGTQPRDKAHGTAPRAGVGSCLPSALYLSGNTIRRDGAWLEHAAAHAAGGGPGVGSLRARWALRGPTQLCTAQLRCGTAQPREASLEVLVLTLAVLLPSACPPTRRAGASPNL